MPEKGGKETGSLLKSALPINAVRRKYFLPSPTLPICYWQWQFSEHDEFRTNQIASKANFFRGLHFLIFFGNAGETRKSEKSSDVTDSGIVHLLNASRDQFLDLYEGLYHSERPDREPCTICRPHPGIYTMKKKTQQIEKENGSKWSQMFVRFDLFWGGGRTCSVVLRVSNLSHLCWIITSSDDVSVFLVQLICYFLFDSVLCKLSWMTLTVSWRELHFWSGKRKKKEQ